MYQVHDCVYMCSQSQKNTYIFDNLILKSPLYRKIKLFRDLPIDILN